MSNVGLNASLLAQNGQDLSPAEQLMADVKQLAQDLKAGDLPAVQQDYVTLSQDLAGADPSASTSAAEAGVIVSLLSDLLSLPIGSTVDPSQFLPIAAGFDYGALLFDRSRTPQDAAATLGPAATGGTPSQDGRSTTQPAAPNAPSANSLASSDLAHSILRPIETGDIVAESAASQRASTASPPIPDQESQAAAPALPGLSSNGVNPLIPGLNPDPSLVLPWTLFDWQLNGYRSQPIPPEFLRKRKNPRGSAARTRSKRQKP